MSIVDTIRHRRRMLLDSDYRELERFKNMPRFTRSKTRLLGKPLTVVDGPSFYWAYRDIWQARCYEFKALTAAPYIIDAGANIGLSVLFFKRLYPSCRLLAFEPDPAVFAALRENVQSFGYANVTLVEKALWRCDGSIRFNAEGADGGRVIGAGTGERVLEVGATRLRTYLQEPVEFLKMDIEGAETDVLEDSRDVLRNVRHLFVEYHSFTDKPQTLHVLLEILAEAGFRVLIQSLGSAVRPFMGPQNASGMDMQLNIFAYRRAP